MLLEMLWVHSHANSIDYGEPAESTTMNEAPATEAPRWFSIISVISLIWNLFGLGVFVMGMAVLNNQEALEKAGLNQQQIDVTLSTPTWVNAAFGVAVIFGVLGCIALVRKRKLAIPLLTISLVGVLAQNAYVYFLSDTVEIMGVGASPLVIAVAIALVPIAVFSGTRNWLT